MVLVFGIDIPLIQIIIIFFIISFLILLEIIIVMLVLTKLLEKAKTRDELQKKMLDALLEIKKKEIEELSRSKRK